MAEFEHSYSEIEMHERFDDGIERLNSIELAYDGFTLIRISYFGVNQNRYAMANPFIVFHYYDYIENENSYYDIDMFVKRRFLKHWGRYATFTVSEDDNWTSNSFMTLVFRYWSEELDDIDYGKLKRGIKKYVQVYDYKTCSHSDKIPILFVL